MSTSSGHEHEPNQIDTEAFMAMRERVVSTLRVTAIFNRHLTAQDAEKTVSRIRPGSLVYTEGMVKPDSERTDDKLIKATFESAAYEDPLLERLADMGCQVMRADFDAERDGEDIINNHSLYTAFVHPFRNFDPAVGFMNHLRKTALHAETNYGIQTFREAIAAETVINDTTALMLDDEHRDYALGPDNAPEAVILYGTAHQDSLPHTFREEGIDVTSVVIGDCPDYSKIEPTYNQYRANRRRRFGHDAIADLIRQDTLVATEAKKELVARSYTGLDYLNQSRNETLRFLAGAIKLRRQYDHDSEAAHHQLISTLSSIVDLSAVPSVKQTGFATDSKGETSRI